MNSLQYITDNKGNKVSVVLPIKDYERMVEELEEFEDIRLYDEAMAANEPSIPIDQAFEMIEAKRKSNGL